MHISRDPDDMPTQRAEPAPQSHLLDLLDVNLSPPGAPAAPGAPADPWGVPEPPQRPVSLLQATIITSTLSMTLILE